jgi:CubicO group peptidase (beta-lactamase class C family)
MKEPASRELMREFPPPIEQRVTLANWQSAPFNRWAFSNSRRLLPAARIHRSVQSTHRFTAQTIALGDLPVAPSERDPKTLVEVLEDTYTDGFLVLHRGRLVYEHYAGALRENATHLVWSVSKSILGSLIGILVERGVLEISRPASYYVSELPHDGYGSVTIDRLLDMRSGMQYSEDYADPESDFSLFDEACGFRPRVRIAASSGVYDYLASLRTDPRDPGDYSYRSTDTDVLGWIAERATGVALEHLFETELWDPLGTEEDADLLVDPVGSPVPDGGFCATLRDIGRFAQMHLEDGALGARQIIPSSWVATCCVGDRAAYARRGAISLFPRGAYARKWWIPDADRRVRLAVGIHGQMIYLDPLNELACVKVSSAPEALNLDMLGLAVDTCARIGRALS